MLLAASGCTGSAALGNDFVYSFAFENGNVVDGSFIGNPESDGLVDDITDVTLSVNGVAVSGPIYVNTLVGSSWVEGGTLSYDAADNDFLFINSDYAGGHYNYNAYFQMDDLLTYEGTPTTFAADTAMESQSGVWSLVDPPGPPSSSSVPDSGASLLMLGISLAGLGMLGSMRLRISDPAK